MKNTVSILTKYLCNTDIATSYPPQYLGRIVLDTDANEPKSVLMTYCYFKFYLLQFKFYQDDLDTARKWLSTEKDTTQWISRNTKQQIY